MGRYGSDVEVNEGAVWIKTHPDPAKRVQVVAEDVVGHPVKGEVHGLADVVVGPGGVSIRACGAEAAHDLNGAAAEVVAGLRKEREQAGVDAASLAGSIGRQESVEVFLPIGKNVASPVEKPPGPGSSAADDVENPRTEWAGNIVLWMRRTCGSLRARRTRSAGSCSRRHWAFVESQGDQEA